MNDNPRDWVGVCKYCHRDNIGYSRQHDAYYCRRCLVWLEDQCYSGAGDDPDNCPYCKNRPDKPVKEQK